jgi:hypothetical protein
LGSPCDNSQIVGDSEATRLLLKHRLFTHCRRSWCKRLWLLKNSLFVPNRLVGTTKVYSGIGADIVMQSITPTTLSLRDSTLMMPFAMPLGNAAVIHFALPGLGRAGGQWASATAAL